MSYVNFGVRDMVFFKGKGRAKAWEQRAELMAMGIRLYLRTLKRRISGCMRERGLPLTLTRPLPA